MTLICKDCDIEFRDSWNYNRHMATAKHERQGAKKIYTCEACKFTSGNKQKYDRHMLTKMHIKTAADLSSAETALIELKKQLLAQPNSFRREIQLKQIEQIEEASNKRKPNLVRDALTNYKIYFSRSSSEN